VNVSSRNRSALWSTMRGRIFVSTIWVRGQPFLDPFRHFGVGYPKHGRCQRRADGTLCLKQDQCDTFPSDRVARGRFHFPLREAGKHRGNQLSQSPWLLGCDSSDHHASITMTDLRLLIGPHRIACLLCPQHEYLGRFD
jgi:hypothetical protein